MQRETHLRLPGDEVQVALLFGEEVVDREPRTCILQYLIQSVSHRPLDQLDAESFFLVCRHVNDTRGQKIFLLDKTMLNTSAGSRLDAMRARISLGMSQSVGGEVRIFLAGGSMATREVAVSSLLPRCVSFQLPIRGIDSAFWETATRRETNR